MDRKNAWTTYSKEELDRLEQVSTEYKNCLDAGKTERECVTLAVEKDIRISEISLKMEKK